MPTITEIFQAEKSRAATYQHEKRALAERHGIGTEAYKHALADLQTRIMLTEPATRAEPSWMTCERKRMQAWQYFAEKRGILAAEEDGDADTLDSDL